MRYKCSKDQKWSSTAYLISKKHTLNTNNFPNYQPYDLCRFCVAARAFTFGITSEPLCQEIRLHEEPPSSAPKISCSSNECLSTRDGHARNVSIAWTIPPRKDWNGVLYELRIFYSSSLENSSHYWHSMKIPVQNNTVNGETLLTGIPINETTFIYMTACNKEGCSDPGRTFKVPPLPPSVTDFNIDTVAESSANKSIIVLASVAALILTACLVGVSYACFKTRRSLQPKIQLTLCEPSGYDVIVHGEKVEYDVIVMTDMPTYVDITQVNDDATQLAAICRLKADSSRYCQHQSQQEKRRVDKVHVLEQIKNADTQTL